MQLPRRRLPYAETGDTAKALAHLCFYAAHTAATDPEHAEQHREARYLIAQMLSSKTALRGHTPSTLRFARYSSKRTAQRQYTSATSTSRSRGWHSTVDRSRAV